MATTILLIGTLDTKSAEYAYVRELIEARGHRALVMNADVTGEPAFPPDISAAEGAAAGGGRLEALRAKADRGAALDVMARGVVAPWAVTLMCPREETGSSHAHRFEMGPFSAVFVLDRRRRFLCRSAITSPQVRRNGRAVPPMHENAQVVRRRDALSLCG